ncbi:unnamed protein product [Didymodactylos carnosus]|uniref:Ubiquitin carboxyl-terminal hydrolase n=1 Tax=Didymodactylos carnosus TaxID=1234261 RepID=A0A8S2GDY7_9BILA|nr:unnamed protein product [Didymodactylos carnosus]CAF3502955.1 unnamed protein product [Didymodactylos carnosus]
MDNTYSNVRVPGANDNVYKDECMYSFDNPESENGLFVCMSTFYGIGKDNVSRHCKLNPGKNVAIENQDTEPSKVTKMAIGLQGGFDLANRFAFDEKYSIYIHGPNIVIPYPENAATLPEHVQRSAAAIIQSESAFFKEELARTNATWDGEIKKVTKHAQTLPQMTSTRSIPPNGWKCDQCDLKDNLWLNLTDGAILCGRKFFDGTGGNNHAVEHYHKTKYPLAVKLGTITAHGADVYSYDEDDLVEDPNLAVHLSHWGVNMLNMEKSEKSMAELEIDLNQRYGEWATIQESNYQLKPIYGPGYTGMRNLGNSCYMNSVMQVLFTIKDYQEKYFNNAEYYFNHSKNVPNPANDFNIQTAKLAQGLLSGNYSKEVPNGGDPNLQGPSGIRPQMFRTLIGENHKDFSTKQQQDAAEYLQYFNELVHRHSKQDASPDALLDPSQCFEFQLEERIYCPSTTEVRYLTREDSMFRLNVALHGAKNMHEVLQYNKTKEDMEKQGVPTQDLLVVRPIVALNQCIAQWAEPESIEDYKLKRNGSPLAIRKTQRFLTFPDFLCVQLKKYTYNPDWSPRKIDVSMEIPDEIDITSLRAAGMQPGEKIMPEEDDHEIIATSSTSNVHVNEVLLKQLVDMGFSTEGCKRALINTGNNNVEAAMNWVFEHQSDPDFDLPYQAPTKKSRKEATQAPVASEEDIQIIMAMGFSRAHALRALRTTNNNIETAVDWALTNPEESASLQTLIDTLPHPVQDSKSLHSKFRDGNGKYRLVAFISHIGSHPNSGHYVCHILKEGRWVIFNDETVALSEHPPKDLAYLYLYKRE